MSIPFEANQTVLFVGDSITDCGRERPVGRRYGLGEGYVHFVDSMLPAKYPETPVQVLNTGISGNRVIDLRDRWQSDVIDLSPQWLSIMIGINDVWRHFDSAPECPQVGPEEYESVYRELLRQTTPKLEGLIMMTPYLIEPNRDDPMRAMMDQYGAIAKRLAEEFGAIYVDTQAAFDAYLDHQPNTTLCEDKVHPNSIGHMVIACAFLDAVCGP